MTPQPPSPVRPGARLTRAGVPSHAHTTPGGPTVNPTAWIYLDGIDARPWGGRGAAARTTRAAAARVHAARRGTRRATRTVAGEAAWVALSDLDRPWRAPFDSHAAHADVGRVRARAELSRRIAAVR